MSNIDIFVRSKKTETLCKGSELTDIVIYTDWANHYLEKAQKKRVIGNLQKDMHDSLLLIDIIEAVIGEKIPNVKKKAKSTGQSVENISCCLQYLSSLGVPLDGIVAKDIEEGHLKTILNLFFNLSRYKQQQKTLSKQANGSVQTNDIVIKETSRTSGACQSDRFPTNSEMLSKLPSPFRVSKSPARKSESQGMNTSDIRAGPSSSSSKSNNASSNDIRGVGSALGNHYSAVSVSSSSSRNASSKITTATGLPLPHSSSSLPHRSRDQSSGGSQSKLPSGQSRPPIGQRQESPKVTSSSSPATAVRSSKPPGGRSLPQPGYNSLRRPSNSQNKDNKDPKMLDKFKFSASTKDKPLKENANTAVAGTALPNFGYGSTALKDRTLASNAYHKETPKFGAGPRIPKSSTRYSSNSSSGFSSGKSEMSDSSSPSSQIQHKSSLPTTIGHGAGSVNSSPKIPIKALSKRSYSATKMTRKESNTASDAIINESQKDLLKVKENMCHDPKVQPISVTLTQSASGDADAKTTEAPIITSPVASHIPSFGSSKGIIPKPTMVVKGMKPVTNPGQFCQPVASTLRSPAHGSPNIIVHTKRPNTFVENSAVTGASTGLADAYNNDDINAAIQEKLRQNFQAQRSHSSVGSPNAVVGIVSPITHHKRFDRPIFDFNTAGEISHEPTPEPFPDTDPQGTGHQSDSSGTQSDTAGSVIFRPGASSDYKKSLSPEISRMKSMSPASRVIETAARMRALSSSPARTHSRLETTFDCDDNVVVTEALPPFDETLDPSPSGHIETEEEEQNVLLPMQPLIPRATPYAYLKNASEKVEEDSSTKPIMRSKSPRLLLNKPLASLLHTRLSGEQIQPNQHSVNNNGLKTNLNSPLPSAEGYVSDGDTLHIPEQLDFSLNGYMSEGGVSLYARKLQARFREGIEAVQKSMGKRTVAVEDNFEDSSSLSSGLSENFDEISTDDLTASSLSDHALNLYSAYYPSRSLPRDSKPGGAIACDSSRSNLRKLPNPCRKSDTGQQTDSMINGYMTNCHSASERGSRSVTTSRKLSADQYDPQRIDQLLQKCRTSSRGMGAAANNGVVLPGPPTANQHRPKSEQLAIDGAAQFSLATNRIGRSRIDGGGDSDPTSPYRRIGPLLSASNVAYGLVGYGSIKSSVGYETVSVPAKSGCHSLDRKRHLMARMAPAEPEPSATNGEALRCGGATRSANRTAPSGDASLLAMLSPRHVAAPKKPPNRSSQERQLTPEEQDVMSAWSRHNDAPNRKNAQLPLVTVTLANSISSMSRSMIEPEMKITAGSANSIIATSTTTSCHEKVFANNCQYNVFNLPADVIGHKKVAPNSLASQLLSTGPISGSSFSNARMPSNYHQAANRSVSGRASLDNADITSPSNQTHLQNFATNGTHILGNTSSPNCISPNRLFPPNSFTIAATDKAGFAEEVHGSSLSIASSNSSAYSTTAEEKYQSEIRKLHREVDNYKEKVQTLTTQQSTYAHVVAAFEQSLKSMTKRVQSLTAVSEQKESELTDLKTKIDMLRKMSVAVGLNIEDILCSPSPGVIRRHTINNNETPALTRQHSSESLNSTASQRSSFSGSNKTTSSKLSVHSVPTSDKKGKKNWLRSSFSKAFNKQKKNKCGSISDVEEGPSVSAANISNPASPLHSARATSRLSSVSTGSPNTSNDLETVCLLKKELDRKDSTLTEVRLDALTSAHEVDQMREMLMRLKSEVQTLKFHNHRLQNMVSRKSGDYHSTRPTSQNSLPILDDEVDNESVSDGGNVVSEFCLPSTVADAIAEDGILGFKLNVAVNISHPDVPQDKSNVLIGCVCLSYKAKWNLLDAVISKIFKEYVLRIDQVSNLGLSSDSILYYDVGGVKRYISDSAASTKLSPASLFDQNKINTVKIILKGAKQNSCDALAFEMLIAKSILQRYISLLVEHRRIVFCGPTGTGKTYLIRKIADYLALRSETQQNRPSSVHFDVQNSTASSDVKNYLSKLAKAIAANDLNSATPAVIVIDNMQNILSLSETFSPLQNIAPQACPYIIGAMKQPSSNSTDLQLYHNFRWVLNAHHMEPVKGLLLRCTRRRQIEREVQLGSRLPPELVKILEWLPKLWSLINKFLEAIHSCEATIGPSIFMNCPLDVAESKEWFVDLWNDILLPYLQHWCNDGLQIFGRRLSFEDPNEFIAKTWPWSDGSSPGSCLSRLKIEAGGKTLDADHLSTKSFNSDAEGDPLVMLMKLKEQAKRQREKEQESMSYQPTGIKSTL